MQSPKPAAAVLVLQPAAGAMGEKEWDPSNVFDVFGDRLARRLLVLASQRAAPADELADALDVSEPTVYRRLNELGEYDLVAEHQQIDADGHHYKTYETTLRQVTLEIDRGGYNVDLELRQDLVDSFDSFWTELEQSQPTGEGPSADGVGADPFEGGS